MLIPSSRWGWIGVCLECQAGAQAVAGMSGSWFGMPYRPWQILDRLEWTRWVWWHFLVFFVAYTPEPYIIPKVGGLCFQF